MSISNPSVEDVEKGGPDYAYLTNTAVRSFSWQDVIVTVKDRKTKQPLEILSGVNGIVEAGRCLPAQHRRILLTSTRRDARPDGTKVSNKPRCVVSSELTDLPSGSGKTTLLNVLAHRAPTANATIQQTLAINGAPTSLASFRKLSSYVEQEDALVGSLTVRETLHFAAQLALPRYAPSSQS